MAKNKKAAKKAAAPAAPKAVAAFVPGTYTSAYGPQLQQAFDNVTNFKYDPMQDASYQALAKIYGMRGNIAAKDTLADAAALNGGMQTSYAVAAAQQQRNIYNQELAAMIPDLEAQAYGRAQTQYGLLKDAEADEYARFRDAEADRQWAWTNQYNAYRDTMGDYFNTLNFNYQKERDAEDDRRWALQYADSHKTSSGGGGGGRKSSGRRGYSYGGGSSGGGNNDNNNNNKPKASTTPFREARGTVNGATYQYSGENAGYKKKNKKGQTITKQRYAGPQM